MALKPGTIVRIFQKPLTDEEFEGYARIETVFLKHPGLQEFLVRFTDDPEWERALGEDGPQEFESVVFSRAVLERHVWKPLLEDAHGAADQ